LSSSAKRAWLLGFGVLLVACGLWLLLLKLETYSPAMATFLWLSPCLAALVAAYLAPSHRFFLGLSMAAPAAILATLLNLTPQLSGARVDFPGLAGGITLFAVVLTGSAVLAALGAVAGLLLAKHRP